MLAQNGALADLIAAGARILECACGPCIGMGQSPNSGGVSLRTFNRNFEGRSGTADAPDLSGQPGDGGGLRPDRRISPIRAPWASCRTIEMPEHFVINDNMIVPPAPEEDMDEVEVLRGPNIKPFPQRQPL